MLFRYLILFGGIVLMITGCNSLISQNFGTHRLRTMDVASAASGSLGDADYVQITEAIIGEAFIVGPALRSSDEDYVLRPILTPEQATAWQKGSTVTINLIAWTETADPACTKPPGCPPAKTDKVIGLLSEPTWRKNPTEEWPKQRIQLAESVAYLQLYEKPMAWYWNLLLFIAGLGLAIVPEARRFAKAKK
ncbi:hypothetical protein [Neolewinella persica]|uniref:hypothetical protein n=1 Tax=Neolewinella persica TaxID=70998 RepID=UPI00036C8443|nr:hypothetical protein [Neolewinella persica]